MIYSRIDHCIVNDKWIPKYENNFVNYLDPNLLDHCPLLLDSHTGSPRRMLDYQVILGTSHGTTSHALLAETIATIFTAHGFEVHHNISGYAGGNIVRTYGRPEVQGIHAIQIEINAALLMTTSRQEFIAQISRGEIPARAEENIARLRTCLREVMTTLPAVLAEIHA